MYFQQQQQQQQQKKNRKKNSNTETKVKICKQNTQLPRGVLKKCGENSVHLLKQFMQNLLNTTCYLSFH